MRLRYACYVTVTEVVKDESGEVVQLRATYDPEVGEDIWDFFFDPETYALVGYRFFRDEAARGGTPPAGLYTRR